MKVAKNITELIGNTPLIELENYRKKHDLKARIIAKLEYFNPGGSIKDRIGYAMIKDAEEKGKLNSETTIIEPTSGNTGIALSYVAAARGYKIILTMPETMSVERRSLLTALGAKLVLTPGDKGMKGAIEKAEELHKSIPNSFIPQQFKNPANPDIHRNTTSQEIIRDIDSDIDYFVAGVGTGGTITGNGEILKNKMPQIKIIAVEPYDSPVLSGGKPGYHEIQGIGAGFIPDVINMKIIDEIVKVKTNQAYEAVRELASTEGILAGVSSGAALFVAGEIAKKQESSEKTIVVIFPDTGERYLSTDLFKL